MRYVLGNVTFLCGPIGPQNVMHPQNIKQCYVLRDPHLRFGSYAVEIIIVTFWVKFLSCGKCYVLRPYNSVCWSYALVNGPTSKRPASDGGRCDQPSVLARHTHMLHCPPSPLLHGCSVPTTPVRSLFRASSVFDSCLLPCRLLLGPICGDVLVWVRMLPTPASTLLQSMHPSTGPQ